MMRRADTKNRVPVFNSTDLLLHEGAAVIKRFSALFLCALCASVVQNQTRATPTICSLISHSLRAADSS